MKNPNNSKSLFKELRLIFLNSTEMKEMPHMRVESGEKIDTKIERLDAVAKIMSKEESERVMNAEFAGSANLHIGTDDKRRLTIMEVDKMCGQMARTVHPTNSMMKDLQHLDFVQAYNENPTIPSTDYLTEKIQKEDKKFNGIVFNKDKTDDHVKIFLVDKDNSTKEIGQFEVKSRSRAKLESKRETFLKEIAAQRKGLDDEKKNIIEMKNQVSTYKEKLRDSVGLNPKQITTKHDELVVGENPETYTLTCWNSKSGKITTKSATIILTYENGVYQYKFVGPSPASNPEHKMKGGPKSKKFSTPEFKKMEELILSNTDTLDIENSLAYRSGKEFVAEIDGRPIYANHTGAFFNANNTSVIIGTDEIDDEAIKTAKEKAEERRRERIVQEEEEAIAATSPIEAAPATPTVAIEKIQDKIVNKIELIVDPDTRLRTLTITTKKGTKLVYKEIKQRTPQNRAIWKYADSEEYYLDSGNRIDPSGLSYEGIGQKESAIIGKHVKIERDTERDIEETTGANVTMVNKPSLTETDRSLMSQCPQFVKASLDHHFGLVKTKLDENEDHPVYSTLEGLVQAISEHGKSMSKDIGKFYEKIKIDFHRVKITWTKENGYDNPENKDLLLIKTIKILKNYLGEEDYVKFIEKQKTLKRSKRLTKAKEIAEQGYRADMLNLLTKKYEIKAFENNHMFEGDMLKNWKLFNGGKAVLKNLRRFNISSNHQIPKLAVKMITEWGNSKVDYKEVLKFAQPNIANVFNKDTDNWALSTIMGKKGLKAEEYMQDPKNLAKVVEKGVKAAETNPEAALFMDKVFSNIVKPIISLLESLENLDVTKREKDNTPKTAENLIWQMMEQGEETCSIFSLPAGNRFKLNKVSQYHNSENLEIGVKQKLVDQIKAGFRKRITEGDLENKYIKYIDKIDNEMLLQALFLTINPETLIKEGCLEMNTAKQLLLTKLPKIAEEPLYILNRVQSIVDGTIENYRGHYELDDAGLGSQDWVEHSDMEILRNRLPLIDRQTKAIKQLKVLCDGGDKRGGLKQLVDRCKGVKKFTYMTQLDGNAVFQDKSRLERQMTGDAAFNYLMYHGEYYDVDAVRGFKTLDIKKLQEEANKFIKLGYLQVYLGKGGEKGKSPSEKEITEALKPGSEFNKELKTLEIKHLGVGGLGAGTLLKKRKEYFQLGLLVEYNTKYEDQIEGMKLPKSPFMRAWVEWALSNEVKPSSIKMAVSKFNAGIAVLTGGGDTSVLFGIGGYPIDLGNGLSLNLSAGISGDGTVGGAVYLGYAFKAGNSTFTLGLGASADLTGGAGVMIGAANRHDYKNSAYEGIVMAGLMLHSYVGLLPALAGGWGRSYEKAYKFKLEETVKEEGLEKIEQLIKNYDTRIPGSKDALLAEAKKFPRFKPLFEHKIGGKLKLTDNTILSLIKFQLMDVQALAATKASKSLAKTDWIPVSEIVLGIPTYIKFSIPAGTVSRPLLKSEAKLLNINSSMYIDSEVEEKLTFGELTGIGVENMSQAYITSDGRIGRMIGESQEMDFSKLSDNAFTNSALAKIRMRVEEKNAGAERVLHIFDADDPSIQGKIEMEIHPDPLLAGELAIHTRKGEGLSLEGNLEDLVITRERFFFPAKTGEHGSSVKDVITIRKKSSAKAGRNRLWIQENEEAYLEKLPGYKWMVKQGENADKLGESKTVFDLQGWESLGNNQLERSIKRARVDEFETSVSDADVLDKMNIVRGTKGSIPETKFEKTEEDIQKEIKESLDKAFEDEKFYKKLASIMDKPGEITKFIADQEKTDNGKDKNDETRIFSAELLGEDKILSDLERNLASQYLTRRYFIDLAAKTMKDAGLSEEHLKALEAMGPKASKEFFESNPKIKAKFVKYINLTREILFDNADYVAEAFETEFDSAIKRLRNRGVEVEKSLTGKKVAKKMTTDIKSKVQKVTLNTKAETLINHPLLTLEVESLMEGSTIMYGTHKAPTEKGGDHTPALAKTLQSIATAERTVRPAGFLKGTATMYEVKSDMGKVLLETSSPVKELAGIEGYKQFLESEFARRLGGLGSIIFVLGNDDYKRLMACFKNPEILTDDPRNLQGNLQAVKEFHELCEEFRRDQLAGKPTVIEYKDIKFSFLLGSETRSISWSDCGNAGFEAMQTGKVKIEKGGKTIVAFGETYETLDPQVRKLYVEFCLGIAVKIEKKKKPPEETPEGGKNENKTGQSGQKAGSNEPVADQPAALDKAPTNYGSDSAISKGPTKK